MKRLYLLFIVSLIMNACYTPDQAFDKGHYKLAMQMASQQIKKGKEIETNTRILQNSTARFIETQTINAERQLSTEDVKKWKSARDRLYQDLISVGKANIHAGYLITDQYDQFCDYKKSVDLKIVDHYYQYGLRLMSFYDRSHQKVYARDAYYEFVEAEKNGGFQFYNDIQMLRDESLEKGIVYYLCRNEDLGSSLFVRKLPRDADFEPDCLVEVSKGMISYHESASESRTSYEKQVQTGTKTEKDTSGQVKTIPVFETRKATLIRITYAASADQTVWIHVKDHTGQCHVGSTSFSETVNDCWEEVKVEGDAEAIDVCYKTGSNKPLCPRSSLEWKLEGNVSWRLSNFY